MTAEEVAAEKRKVLYHWLGMLNSIKRLQDAGEIDIDSTIEKLTAPALLKRVNDILDENPNLLETKKYILLCSLLQEVFDIFDIPQEEICKNSLRKGKLESNTQSVIISAV